MRLSREDILNTILEYLDLLANGRGGATENLEALDVVLDKLALAYHFAEYETEGIVYPDAVREEYERMRKLTVEQFPDFGYYNKPSSVTGEVAEAQMFVGDAVDDVADMAVDLLEVAWRWQNTSVDDALWHFRLGYESHWGEHLRYLQLYIRASKEEA